MSDLLRSSRLRTSAAHVVVADVDRPVLAPEDHHHLARVLRLRPGVEITLTDGRGSWRPAVWRGDHDPEPVDAARIHTRPSTMLTVVFAPPKGDRADWVVQKLTELGVDRIVPVLTERSVVRWDHERGLKQVERWRRIAREALSQSRGLFLPQLDELMPLHDVVRGGPVRFAEPGGGPPVADGVAVVVGPEGGFTDDEMSWATGTVGLPGGVLRAETAAVALGVLLVSDRDRSTTC